MSVKIEANRKMQGNVRYASSTMMGLKKEIRVTNKILIKTNTISHGMASRGAGTYKDTRTCPDHVLRQSLGKFIFLKIILTNF